MRGHTIRVRLDDRELEDQPALGAEDAIRAARQGARTALGSG